MCRSLKSVWKRIDIFRSLKWGNRQSLHTIDLPIRTQRQFSNGQRHSNLRWNNKMVLTFSCLSRLHNGIYKRKKQGSYNLSTRNQIISTSKEVLVAGRERLWTHVTQWFKMSNLSSCTMRMTEREAKKTTELYLIVGAVRFQNLLQSNPLSITGTAIGTVCCDTTVKFVEV